MVKINNCRVCQSQQLERFFDLGSHPLANSLLDSQDQEETTYPLSLSWCRNCNLVQLDYTVDPHKLFPNYVWMTGTSKTTQEFSHQFYRELISRVEQKTTEGYVLEIASNDGTFLTPFKDDGYEVLGVDPAKNIVGIANQAGIPTKVEFWGEKFAHNLLCEKGLAKIVLARNVLPHVANTHDFVQGLHTILADEGILAIEVHYAKIIVEELHYDSIYHEHLCYFTMKSLERLLNDHGLYIFDMMKSPISGGSIIVYAKKYKVQETSVVQQCRNEEIKGATNELSTWKKFADRSFLHKEKLLDILRQVKSKGLVVGYGASARSSTLLNFCGINSNIIDMIADQNQLKQGKFTAGTHIPIKTPKEAMTNSPRFVFILAWNFTDEIIKILEKKFNFKGCYIIPLPDFPKLLPNRTHNKDS